MAIELECKLSVESHEPIRSKLREAGAEEIANVLETNHIFDCEAGRLQKSGCALRVRSSVDRHGNDQKATMTYKGPKGEGPFKRREELEVIFDDAETMKSILHALGFQERIVYEKRRESWRLESCRVELDEVPTLGTFVEVEGPTESAIRSALRRLGLENRDPINKSYVFLLVEACDHRDSAKREFRFS